MHSDLWVAVKSNREEVDDKNQLFFFKSVDHGRDFARPIFSLVFRFGIKLNKRHREDKQIYRMEWLKEDDEKRREKNECIVCVWMRFTCVASAQWCFYLFPGNLMSNHSKPQLRVRSGFGFVISCGQSEKNWVEFDRKCWNLYAQCQVHSIAIKIEWTFKATVNFLLQSQTAIRQIYNHNHTAFCQLWNVEYWKRDFISMLISFSYFFESKKLLLLYIYRFWQNSK